MCLISRYREINSRYPKITIRSENNSRYREMINKNPNGFPYTRGIRIPDIGKSISDIGKWSISRYREMIFGYRELIFRYREICLISRYREINSRYPKIATRQKQVTPPPCKTALPHRPLSTTAPSHTDPICLWRPSLRLQEIDQGNQQ